MDNYGMTPKARFGRGLLAGAIAGVAASFVMDRFQAVAAPLFMNEPSSGATEPSTVVAAAIVAEHLGMSEIPTSDKPLAGQAVHYAFGTVLGLGYGVVAAIRPTVTVGAGSAMGAAACLVFDEGFVPIAGLGAGPTQAPLKSHLFSLTSHLVFGVTAELVRRQVDRTLHRQD